MTRNTDILDDIPPGAYTALWSPKSIYPEEMLSYEVLIPGESRYMTSSEVPAKKYGERPVRFQMAVIVLFKSVLLLNDNMLLNYSQNERETLPLTD